MASPLFESAETPDSSLVTVKKEMGYSLPEFLNQFHLFSRYFPIIFQEKMSITIKNDLITLIPEKSTNNALELNIELLVLPDRCLGALVLPRLQVYFCFTHFSEQNKTEFLKQFDRSFQKGGG
ncbi:MAG: hypothetical protein GY694_02375 [Gammaproteobacteria bacterium]|nr:hypothetical protein [Gammaproteobacteria bacterium]